MKKSMRIMSIVLCIVMLLSVPAYAESGYATDYKPLEESNENTYFTDIVEAIHNVYLYDVEDEDLFKRAIQTMLKEHPELLEEFLRSLINSLDDYSQYFTAEEWTAYKRQLEQEFGGIGVNMAVQGDYIVVLSMVPNMPAEKAGMMIGDKLISVDGQDVVGMSTEKIRPLIIGDPDTSVEISVLRGEQEMTFTMKREIIKSDSVFYTKMDNIAYIYITSFNQTTDEELTEILKKVDADGITKIVLDLRYNPGGYLDTAINVAQNFVLKGLVASAYYKYGDVTQNYNSNLEKKKYDLVVLINRYSASASELLSSAIQESGGGVLVGERSFGKAVIQGEFQVYKGSYAKLTIGAYLTRKGNQINKIGIEPNYKVDNKEVGFEFSGAKPLDFMKKLSLGDQGEDVLAAKQRLTALGYYVGEMDEVFGQPLADAVSKFQKDTGLFPYGVLDINTLIMLDNKANETTVVLDLQLSKAIELLGGKPLYDTTK